MKKNNNKKKKGFSGLWFLAIVILTYVILIFYNYSKTVEALKTGGEIFLKIVPVLIGIILFMGIINYFLSAKKVIKYLGQESGIKGWIIAAGAGILSHGSIYLWYNLLKDLREKGMSAGLAGVFLYTRAIKLPLLPLMIKYFGLTYVLLISFYIVIASYIEGIVLNLFLPEKL
ncbi:MAG: permease [Elusimicrobiota bacterium]